MPVCCQFGYFFFIFNENEQYFVLAPPDRKQSRPIISGGTTSFFSLASISFHQAEPVWVWMHEFLFRETGQKLPL